MGRPHATCNRKIFSGAVLAVDAGAAEKQFRTAMVKAQSEVGDRRNLHLYTSLQELRMIFNVLGDKKGLDWADGELIECEVPALDKESQYSWDEALKKAGSASTSFEFQAAANMAVDLVLNGSSVSNKRNSRAMLQLIQEKFDKKDEAKLPLDQIVLIDAYVAQDENGLPISLRAMTALSNLSKCQPEALSAEMSSVLITLGISELVPASVEKFAEYYSQHGRSATYKFVAQSCLSEIYRLTGR